MQVAKSVEVRVGSMVVLNGEPHQHTLTAAGAHSSFLWIH